MIYLQSNATATFAVVAQMDPSRACQKIAEQQVEALSTVAFTNGKWWCAWGGSNPVLFQLDANHQIVNLTPFSVPGFTSLSYSNILADDTIIAQDGTIFKTFISLGNGTWQESLETIGSTLAGVVYSDVKR